LRLWFSCSKQEQTKSKRESKLKTVKEKFENKKFEKLI